MHASTQGWPEAPRPFRKYGFRFYFYANEGSPLEPCHVHVEKGDGDAKVWLQPELKIASQSGFSTQEIRDILALIEEHRSLIEGELE